VHKLTLTNHNTRKSFSITIAAGRETKESVAMVAEPPPAAEEHEEDQTRRDLEQKINENRATPSDLRELLSICRHTRDRGCVARVEKLIK